MYINIEKTYFTTICKLGNYSKSAYSINKSPINYKISIKILGIIIDNRLNWHEHVAYVKKKTIASIHFINRNYKSCNTHFKVRLFKILVHPIITYNIHIWFNSSKTIINTLDKIYKFAARLFTKSYDFNGCTTKIVLDNDFPSWRSSEFLFGQKLFFKITNNMTLIKNDDYFHINTYNHTRKHELNYVRGKSRCNTHLHSPS